MKLHHFALFFAVIAVGFFVTAQIKLVEELQEESREKTEYDCLVAAVNAAVETVFTGADIRVTKTNLIQAEEAFFQTLAVLRMGSTETHVWEAFRETVPCLVVFEEDGYYRYGFVQGKGYAWSERIPYERGEIPQTFFSETEELLSAYHALNRETSGKYRVEQAGEGIWERSIEPPCVFAVYAPQTTGAADEQNGFLYAASGRRETAYYVTEDNYCHLEFCERYQNGTVVARYATQKESAEDGAMPCEECLKK